MADHLSRLRNINIDDIEQILVISETEESIVDWNLKELVRLQDEHEYMKEIPGKYESGRHKKGIE